MGPEQQGQVPTAVPAQSQSNTVSAEAMLSNIFAEQSKISEGLRTSLQGVLKPIVAQKQGPSPELLMSPQHQFQRQPLDRTRLVGAHNVKKQDIGNLITAVSNVVGTKLQEREIEKRRGIAIDIERIYETTAGIQEAKQAIETAKANGTTNPEAEKALAKNQEIQNSLLNDPKKAKAFEKAFNINFIDPSKNDHLEGKARQEASKSFQEKQTRSDQLQAQQAQHMAPNQQAMQQYTMLMAQQAALTKVAKPLIDSLNKDKEIAGRLAVARSLGEDKKDIAQTTQTGHLAVAETQQTHADTRNAATNKANLQKEAMRDRAMYSTTALRMKTLALINDRKLDTVKEVTQIKGTQAEKIAATKAQTIKSQASIIMARQKSHVKERKDILEEIGQTTVRRNKLAADTGWFNNNPRDPVALEKANNDLDYYDRRLKELKDKIEEDDNDLKNLNAAPDQVSSSSNTVNGSSMDSKLQKYNYVERDTQTSPDSQADDTEPLDKTAPEHY